jgi:hypothetical protein
MFASLYIRGYHILSTLLLRRLCIKNVPHTLYSAEVKKGYISTEQDEHSCNEIDGLRDWDSLKVSFYLRAELTLPSICVSHSRFPVDLVRFSSRWHLVSSPIHKSQGSVSC